MILSKELAQSLSNKVNIRLRILILEGLGLTKEHGFKFTVCAI